MQETQHLYYIYALLDPRYDKRPFYIGKGCGDRARSHLQNCSRVDNKFKDNVIAAIRLAGFEPEIEYLAENIVDEIEAYSIETAMILKYGRKGYEAGGILTNVCLDNRPPSHRGRSYEEIYGPERAKEQIEKRRALQIAAGGYGPKKFSDETKLKLSIARAGKLMGPHTEETKQKIGAAARLRKGALHRRAQRYIISNPAGNSIACFGWAEVKEYCKANNLSYGTFQRNISDGWPPSKRGKNKGWMILQMPNNLILPQDAIDELKALAILPDSQIDLTDIPEQKDWSGARRGVFYKEDQEVSPSQALDENSFEK